jgi:hypothetical protein
MIATCSPRQLKSASWVAACEDFCADSTVWPASDGPRTYCQSQILTCNIMHFIGALTVSMPVIQQKASLQNNTFQC